MADRNRPDQSRISTQHPDPDKQGVNIDRRYYDAMARALMAVIPRRKDGVAFGELPKLVAPKLRGTVFDGGGSLMWYLTTIKLDLEARGRIERVPGAKPQRVRRV